jgi:hypothetical protein
MCRPRANRAGERRAPDCDRGADAMSASLTDRILREFRPRCAPSATGVERDKAEHVADVVFDAIRENVATKVDIAAARAEVEQARIALNARIDLV